VGPAGRMPGAPASLAGDGRPHQAGWFANGSLIEGPGSGEDPAGWRSPKHLALLSPFG